jgi:hypothetical protein
MSGRPVVGAPGHKILRVRKASEFERDYGLLAMILLE